MPFLATEPVLETPKAVEILTSVLLRADLVVLAMITPVSVTQQVPEENLTHSLALRQVLYIKPEMEIPLLATKLVLKVRLISLIHI
ncbi:hypothetical protein [Fibrisoma montanum]|uniref:hypothetical protein n=1 Tax=Fibrisoma montanum TaxID=2305895 RepID=UPI000E69245D|nr:hypothetical protein [Fibrisoma montanum]